MRDINFGTLPIFSGLDRVDLVKLIPSFIREEYPSGTALFLQATTSAHHGGQREDVRHNVIRIGIVLAAIALSIPWREALGMLG